MTTYIGVETAENGKDTFKIRNDETMNCLDNSSDETSWKNLLRGIHDLNTDGTIVNINPDRYNILEFSARKFTLSPEGIRIPSNQTLVITVLPSIRSSVNASKITIKNIQE